MVVGRASEDADGNRALEGGLRLSEDRMLLHVVGDACTGAFPSPGECAGLVQAAMDAQRCAAANTTREFH